MNGILDHILAKPDETLLQHTDAVVERWQLLRQRYCQMLDLPEDFWRHSYWSVLFHDFGKVCTNFQDALPPRKSGWERNRIRHEFLSGNFMLLANAPEFLEKQPLGVFAVFSHHKPLTDELFQGDANQRLMLPQREYHALQAIFKEKSQGAGFHFEINAARADAFGKGNCKGFYKQFDKFSKNLMPGFSSSDRRKYIFFKALLNIADWLGSSHRNLSSGLIYNAQFLQEKIIQKLQDENKPFKDFRFKEFQLDSCKQGSVLAIAPTGSGKTEAALLWASQKEEFEKIVYLLPTRVTSNAIFLRLGKYFGEDNCGVVHSSARLFLKEMKLDQDRKYILDRTFFKELTVCTIDQILTQGFNLGFWEIKTFHLFRAKVIIDEIHLYQPYTLALIVETVRYLRKEFQTQFFIMTATMPQKLLNLLSRTLEIGEENIIRDSQLLNEARNTFEVRKNSSDEMDDEIKSWLLQNKKVLVVVNTVDEAVRLYEKYKPLTTNRICFHSRFIQKDRVSKEALILEKEKSGEPFLLVATQVVEVSLDIDFDVLFTENAPIDALIQRAGRVNRGRKKADSKVIVFRHQEFIEDKIYPEEVLEKTFTLLSERDGERLQEKMLTELVDLVYENFDVENDEGYLRGKNAYTQIQTKLCFIKDNDGLDETYTREGLDSVNIIPTRFEEFLSNKDELEKTKHEVSIRRQNLHRGKCYKDKKHSWFRYFDCIYDEETGLKFLPKPTTYVSGESTTKHF
ncbi:MAG: CRISPR-associated helicase Cas3' [Chitinophagales bacterium]|nr:CRISPR-associated helicase Cas3' [Chitinophagales bacterium]